MNYVDVHSAEKRIEKFRYLLDRRAGQNSFIWTGSFDVVLSPLGYT